MLNRIRIVELFKKPLFIVYREKKIYWLGFRESATYKKLKKSRGLINLKELIVKL